MHFLIYGFGLVAQSLTNILLKEDIVQISDVMIAENNISNIDKFIKLGGRKENILYATITKNNMSMLFERLIENDFLIALCGDTDYVYLLEESLKRKIHLISASDGSFIEDRDEKIPEYIMNIRKYKAIKAEISKKENIPTSVLEFGMNPGMVSIFTKRALELIVEKDNGSFVSSNRIKLKKLIYDNKYAELSYLLKVRKITLSDYDNLTFSAAFEQGKKYSTWNVSGMFEELLDNSAEILGSFDTYHGKDCCYFDKETGYFVHNVCSIKNEIETVSAFKNFSGFLMNHEELLTLSQYYTFPNANGLIYRPGIQFIYKPNDYIVQSGLELYKNEVLDECLLTGDMILANGEAVGALLEGENFTSVFVGNYLDKKDVGNESPTILQVSASLYAAIKYILNHPNSGMLFAEELNTSEILSYAKKYLIRYIETTRFERN